MVVPDLTASAKAKTHSILEEFCTLLSIPTTAEHPQGLRDCAVLIKRMLEARGVDTRLVEYSDAAPLVVGFFDVGAERTVAIYSHYDGQPAKESNWANDPWQPTLYNGRIEDGATPVSLPGDIQGDLRLYARSTSDDKAPTQALCSALDILREQGLKPSVNLLVITEGEEECGSPNLEKLLAQVPETGSVEGWLIFDGPMHPSRRRQVVLGARGVVSLQLTVFGPNRTLHSGQYGNWIPNPAMRLVHLLASMRDEKGYATVKGLLKEMRTVSESQREALDAMPKTDAIILESLSVFGPEDGMSQWNETVFRPAINLHGIEAGLVQRDATNAIMQRACASLDIRLVPDQTLEGARSAIEDHVKSEGFFIVHEEPTAEILQANEKVILVEWGEGYSPKCTPLDSPFAQRVISAAQAFEGEDIVVNPMIGASVPIMKMIAGSEKPVAILPIANHDNNQHGANENIRVHDLIRGVALYATVLTQL